MIIKATNSLFPILLQSHTEHVKKMSWFQGYDTDIQEVVEKFPPFCLYEVALPGDEPYIGILGTFNRGISPKGNTVYDCDVYIIRKYNDPTRPLFKGTCDHEKGGVSVSVPLDRLTMVAIESSPPTEGRMEDGTGWGLHSIF